MTLRLGWFTSARGPGSRATYEAVVDGIAAGQLDVEIAFVFCNREPGEDPVTDSFFDLVRANGHPLVTRSSVRYRRAVNGQRSHSGESLPSWRSDFDRLVMGDLEAHPFDMGVMAGYMLIFTPAFVARHPLLNLHPALPDGPIGTWREVIRSLIRKRALESGVMVHLAIAEVDAGPVVVYCRYSIRGSQFEPLWEEIEPRIDLMDDDALEAAPLFRAIRDEGLRHESPFLMAALTEFASGRLQLSQPMNGSGALGLSRDSLFPPVSAAKSESPVSYMDGNGQLSFYDGVVSRKTGKHANVVDVTSRVHQRMGTAEAAS